jgi:hypothetical protein
MDCYTDSSNKLRHNTAWRISGNVSAEEDPNPVLPPAVLGAVLPLPLIVIVAVAVVDEGVCLVVPVTVSCAGVLSDVDIMTVFVSAGSEASDELIMRPETIRYDS